MATTDRRSSRDDHVLTGAAGRAGAPLQVRSFTILGFDTGCALEQGLDRVDPVSVAGRERPVRRTRAPRFPEFARGEQDLYAAPGPLPAERGGTRGEHGTALARTDLISALSRD